MLLFRATKECNSTLLNLAVHKFDPQGVTSIAMLAESHISIHTIRWLCDVLPGDTATPEVGVEYMKEQFDIVSDEFVRPLE